MPRAAPIRSDPEPTPGTPGPTLGAPPPPPLTGRVRSLATIGAIRQELARLYRLTRAGRMAVDELSKFANVLQILARLVSDGDLEKRVAALEAAQEGR